jgi:hypothetical protein
MTKTPWHVDLVAVWQAEGGDSRYNITWSPEHGYQPMAEDDDALQHTGAAPSPIDMPWEAATGVAYLAGKRLRFEFDAPLHPVASLLHIGDVTHKPRSIGGDAELWHEFDLTQIDDVI